MRCVLLFCLAFLLLSSFSKPALKPFHIYGFTQGTSYQVTYYAEDNVISKAQIEHLLSEIDSSLSIYKPYSLISRFNQSASGLQADEHLKSVVKKSLEVSRKTGGAFDITVQPLVQAWGFGTKPVAAPPDSASILLLLKCVGPGKVTLLRNQLRKSAPCIRIDVNGIAQGYTVDVLANYLEKQGIRNYLIEVGGEIRVKGRKQPGGALMSIGIEGPDDQTQGVFPIQKVIRLENGAITASGNYRKFYQSGNKTISHLIDPKTGFPVQNELISVTVWAKNALTADGYDNALMGMGLDKALQFVNGQKNMEAYFIYHRPDGTVADTATTRFYKLME
ncbi:FAD:protein FMN transferase [Pontibacter sp. 172403-2]|uniref:FAD:protein FMN transferase n=1 Tax=Pontibacter rufus TaxID=2791028 RepID=UPI0018AFE093|nr:FAD:protein FMN transferase [Pontibacter sp. 172403-2]MBF9255486.1 FAD:protein FMN transferase [Pontibacter sp. 172403-2]